MSEGRFRFGPLDRRGLVMGLRVDQLAAIAGGLLTGLVVLRSSPTVPGILTAVAIATAAAFAGLWPFRGQTIVEWLPVTTRFLVRRLRGRHRFLSETPLTGGLSVPHALRGLTLLEAPIAEEHFGVIRDGRAGYVAVLALRGRSFALLDNTEKTRRLAGWGSVLSGLARSGSPISVVQWVERAVPDDQDALGRYLQEALELPLSAPSVRSYLELVDEAAPVTQQHEVLLAVRLDPRRCHRHIRQAGGGDAGACQVLLRELQALEDQLRNADVRVDGVLTPRMLARAIRTAFDPGARSGLSLIGAGEEGRKGTAPRNAWPFAAQEDWSTYRTDSAVHATYWIAEWPRMDVGPDWMAPLVLQTQVTRTVSLVMSPVDPARAAREVESSRTQDAADEELRQRAGFLATARRRRQQEAIVGREEELASGHAEVRFSGYVTVSAPDLEALDGACGEIEQAAQLARLELRRLYGRQAEAFTFTLSLCRGLH